MEKAREFQKNIYLCFVDYAKAFDCMDHDKLLKILKEMGIPDHQTCLLRNLYAGQEATVRTGHGTTDCFQLEKGVCQGCIYYKSSPQTPAVFAEFMPLHSTTEKVTLNKVYCHLFLLELRLDIEEICKHRRPS